MRLSSAHVFKYSRYIFEFFERFVDTDPEVVTLPPKTRELPSWLESPPRPGPPLQPSNEPILEASLTNDTTIRVSGGPFSYLMSKEWVKNYSYLLVSLKLQVSWDFEKPIISNDEYKVVCKTLAGKMVDSIKVDFEQREAIFYNLGEPF